MFIQWPVLNPGMFLNLVGTLLLKFLFKFTYNHANNNYIIVALQSIYIARLLASSTV
jgi:hypothetical protein